MELEITVKFYDHLQMTQNFVYCTEELLFPQSAGRISTKTVRLRKTLLNSLSEVNLYFQLSWDGEIVGFGYPAIHFSNSQNHKVSEFVRDLKRSNSAPC